MSGQKRTSSVEGEEQKNTEPRSTNNCLSRSPGVAWALFNFPCQDCGPRIPAPHATRPCPLGTSHT